MGVLLLIAFLFSHNRKAIAWKTVGIGLGLQLLLACGVLRVEWVRDIFEVAGSFFLLILDFTKAGSDFVFGNLMDKRRGDSCFSCQIRLIAAYRAIIS